MKSGNGAAGIIAALKGDRSPETRVRTGAGLVVAVAVNFVVSVADTDVAAGVSRSTPAITVGARILATNASHPPPPVGWRAAMVGIYRDPLAT